MTPASLFKRIMRNQILLARFANPKVLPVVGRTILSEVLKLVACSPEPGVFRPDPFKDGVDPLPHIIARSMSAVGEEELIREQLAILARLDFLIITEDNCIVIDLRTGARSSPAGGSFTSDAGDGARKAAAARRNGSLGGKPRNGETPEAYRARREREAAQGSLMLPLDGGQGAMPYGPPVVGEKLAEQLRSQMRLVPEPVTHETQLGLKTVTHAVTQGADPVAALGSVGLPEPRREEEEDSITKALKEEPISQSSSSSARVQAPAEPKTQNPEPTAANPPAGTQGNGPIATITSAAIELAERFKARWGGNATPKAAQRCFQDRLQEGWTVQHIEQAIDSDRAVDHPGLYKKVLPQLFPRGPGQSDPSASYQHLAPAQRPDTRDYPPELGGEWTEHIARIRSRMQQIMGEVEYRSWLKDARFVSFNEDRELQIWSAKPFMASRLRNDIGIRMLMIVQKIVPDVVRLDFTAPALARTG